ncbi:hypothetical protein [Kitasatospora sp. NPDC085464]|uniref:hypothetical protein n=1 Tax=Kitasatospora sp. NPDC085464 TaxID=3364063 RepID=UPI0037CAA40D
MPDTTKRIHNPAYLLNRPGLIPTGTPLRLTWARTTAKYAQTLDAWVAADPLRNAITFAADGDRSGYVRWGYDLSQLFTGAALVRRITDEAGCTMTGDDRSGRSFEGTAHLLLPEKEPYYGLSLRDYALALRHADEHPERA